MRASVSDYERQLQEIRAMLGRRIEKLLYVCYLQPGGCCTDGPTLRATTLPLYIWAQLVAVADSFLCYPASLPFPSSMRGPYMVKTSKPLLKLPSPQSPEPSPKQTRARPQPRKQSKSKTPQKPAKPGKTPQNSGPKPYTISINPKLLGAAPLCASAAFCGFHYQKQRR